VTSRDFFGVLGGFPHTYSFVVSEPTAFTSSVLVRDTSLQKNDVSLIVVKQERRGVTEVGRTKVQEASWEQVTDAMLVEKFRQGGTIEAELEQGSYILEVSAPNNDGQYRLLLGDGDAKRGYIDSVRTLFLVKKLFGSPVYTVLFSPLLYIPMLLVLLLGALFVFGKYIKK
jgi:hypothetical protein